MKNIHTDLKEKVNKIRDEYCSESSFDLLNRLLDHGKQIQLNNALNKTFLGTGKDLAILKEEIDSTISSLIRLERLSSFTQDKLNIEEKITHKRKYVAELTEYLNWLSVGARAGKNYSHSDAKANIHRLAFIFYEMTGEIPTCISNRESEYRDEDLYTGNFYDFLIKIKGVINDIGIKLPDKRQSIGKYAYQIINGYPERSYKLQLFSEGEPLKHGIIYIELSTENRFKYIVIAPNEVTQSGEIYFEDIVSSKNKKFDNPLITIPMLNRSKEAILRITSSRSHTLLHPPLKVFLDRFTTSADAVFNY